MKRKIRIIKPIATIVMATLFLSSCEKINTIFGNKDNEKEKEEQKEPEKEETIYDIEWVQKVPDGEWLKLYPMYDSLGYYISDTCIAKTTPEGGLISWSIICIEGGKPVLRGAGKNAVSPKYDHRHVVDIDTTVFRWNLVATVNKGTEHEKSIKGEYFTRPITEGKSFFITDDEEGLASVTFKYINMKLGDTIKLHTVKVPEDHTNTQTTYCWRKIIWNKDGLSEVNKMNKIYKIILPRPANWCYITAIGVGEDFEGYIDRFVRVTE